MYAAYVTRIKNLRKHTNADRLLCGECFGNTVIVGLDTKPEELGVYFPVDGKLGTEYAVKNDLLRRKDENGKPAGGYLDPEKRNIKALKLRGEKSDGLFMPLSSLNGFTDIAKLREGDVITILNGVTICEKYIPRRKNSTVVVGVGRTRKHHDPIAPLFAEHTDTEQLAYNLGAFHAGDLVEITLKMHGTSQRTGYLPTLKGYKKSLFDKILHRIGSPIYSWGYVTGTRRVVLDDFDGGFMAAMLSANSIARFLRASFIRVKLYTTRLLALRKTSSLLWHLVTIKKSAIRNLLNNTAKRRCLAMAVIQTE